MPCHFAEVSPEHLITLPASTSRRLLTRLVLSERYTCYDLGESLLVGGGDHGSGAADGGQGDMERVMPLHLYSS